MSKNVASKRVNRWWLGALALGTASAALPDDASAHFVLDDPMSWRAQDGLGNPQKLGPCGDDGTAATTGAVTAFQTGQTISITIHETIFHPGHYRVALSVNDRSELPAEPTVTPGTPSMPSTPCGSVPIMDPPVFPVLADGVLVHTAPFSGPQTFDVTLPAGVTCDHCTLQIIEFMSNHPLNDPGGCFYHHCADISIHDVVVGDAGMSVDAGATTMTDAGMSVDAGGGSVDSGGSARDAATSSPPPQACACSTPGRADSSSGAGLALAVLAGVSAWRRRARR